MKRPLYEDMSFVEMAYNLLIEEKKAISFADILLKIAEAKGYTQEHLTNNKAQYYTDLNIDGRFIKAKGEWALKAWFPVDYIDDELETIAIVKPTKSKKANKEADSTAAFEDDNFEDIIAADDLEEYLEDDDEENEDTPGFPKDVFDSNESLFDKNITFTDE